MRFLLSGGSGIGDLIFTLPLGLALKEKYPNCCVDILFGGNAKLEKVWLEILALTNGVIDHIYFYNNKDGIHDLKVLLQLRKNTYDYGLILRYKNQPESIWLKRILRFTGAKLIALKGYAIYNDNADISIDIGKAQLHNVDAYFAVLQYFQIKQTYRKNEYYFRVLNKQKIEKVKLLGIEEDIIPLKKECICLCIGANVVRRKVNGKYLSNDIKTWPAINWLNLANRLSCAGKQVILIGGKQEKEKIAPVQKLLQKNVLNLVDQTNIQESIAIVNKADIVVGCDTGLMHCAAALNIPTLMLLGAVSPAQAQGYGPKGYSVYLSRECSPCYGSGRDLYCAEPACMNEITVDKVYNSILDLLNKNNR